MVKLSAILNEIIQERYYSRPNTVVVNKVGDTLKQLNLTEKPAIHVANTGSVYIKFAVTQLAQGVVIPNAIRRVGSHPTGKQASVEIRVADHRDVHPVEADIHFSISPFEMTFDEVKRELEKLAKAQKQYASAYRN